MANDLLAALRAITHDRIAYQRQVEGLSPEAATVDALGFVEVLTTAIDSGVLEFLGWEPVVVVESQPQVQPETRQMVML